MESTPPFTNRLAAERSPYLLQHAHNPVDWYPWGEEALTRARDENKPVFLSIGYSACHWCHVMEHESFENPAIAQLLNDKFVSIKVDREERPDVDEIYMTAVQMITGSGGWPLSLFLLPDGRPFYGGTYFPPTSRYNRIGFPSLLTQLADAWVNRSEEIEQSAASMVDELRKISGVSHPANPDSASVTVSALLERVVGYMTERFDAANGGFGGAPKFPPHHALRLLTLAAQRGVENADAMLQTTLDRMAIGGIYDHVGGGFHRYATDAIWLLPHFEKMLYDNALLARVYAEAFALTGTPAYARIARETCDWMLRDLLDERGGFQAALDADSEGEEGKYYVWVAAQVAELVGEPQAGDWTQSYHFAVGGNFHDEATGRATGANIPHLGAGDLHAVLPSVLSAESEATRAALLAQRYRRVPPGRDDKVIAAWNGLAIGALAVCGQRFGESRYVVAARNAASFCLTTLRSDKDRLLRRYAKGDAGIDAFLDDYAFLTDGLLDLFDVTGETAYADAARQLARIVIADFTDPAGGGFFYTAGHHETLIARTKDSFDGALPSANGVMARALVRLAALPGGSEFADAAERQRAAYAGLLARAPEAVSTLVETEVLADEATPAAPAAIKPVALTLIGEETMRLQPGETTVVAFRLTIASGYHIDAYASGDSPTTVTFATDAPAAIGPVTYPPSTIWVDPLGEPLKVYMGMVTLQLPVAVAAEAKPGRYALPLRVRYQACSETSCAASAEDVLELTVLVE